MNKTDLLKQQTDLRAVMTESHAKALKCTDAIEARAEAERFSEAHKKFQELDLQLAEIANSEERAAQLKAIEERAEKPAGRVASPAGAQKSEAEIRGGKEYEDNFQKWFRSGGKMEARALSLYNDADGGYTLAPAKIESEIIKPVKNLSIIQSLSKYDMVDGTLSSQGLNLTGVTGNSQKGVAVSLTTESTTGESFAFSQRRMMSHPFVHWLKVPNSLMHFAGFDLLGFIMEELRERKAVQDDYRFIYGTGIEEPLGLLVDNADGIPASTRDKVVTASGVCTYALLLAAYMNQKPQHRAMGSWVVDTNAVKQILGLVDSQSRPLEMLGLHRGDMPTLFGKPLYESNNIQPTLSSGAYTSSQYLGLFGNFKRYAIMESKQVGVKLDPYRLSDEDVTVVYVRTWLDGMPQQAEAFTRLISN